MKKITLVIMCILIFALLVLNLVLGISYKKCKKIIDTTQRECLVLNDLYETINNHSSLNLFFQKQEKVYNIKDHMIDYDLKNCYQQLVRVNEALGLINPNDTCLVTREWTPDIAYTCGLPKSDEIKPVSKSRDTKFILDEAMRALDDSMSVTGLFLPRI